MRVLNVELLGQSESSVKLILNERAVAFFPATQQHRDIKTHELSYEDDYRGNAVAGLITPGRVEIRFHQAYTDERIRNIWSRLLAEPELATIALGALYYQGRQLR